MSSAAIILDSASVRDHSQDTAGVAYVPKVGGPPDSSAYMWAGYTITLVTYGVYAALLFRRLRSVRGRPKERSGI